MRTAVWVALAGVVATCSCATNGQRTDVQAPASSARAGPKDSTMQIPMIDRQTVSRVLKENGVIVVIRVKSAQVLLAGTRSEHANITGEVLEPVLGEPGKTLELRRYTSKGDPLLQAGSEYVVAAVPNARYGTALQLEGFVPTNDQSREQAAAEHRKLVESLSNREQQ